MLYQILLKILSYVLKHGTNLVKHRWPAWSSAAHRSFNQSPTQNGCTTIAGNLLVWRWHPFTVQSVLMANESTEEEDQSPVTQLYSFHYELAWWIATISTSFCDL